MKKFLITAIIALSAASASANDYIEHQDLQRQKLRTKPC